MANSKDVFLYLPTGIDSVDIKSAICGRINCNEKLYGGAPDPFRPRAGDVIHPVLWVVR